MRILRLSPQQQGFLGQGTGHEAAAAATAEQPVLAVVPAVSQDALLAEPLSTDLSEHAARLLQVSIQPPSIC